MSPGRIQDLGRRKDGLLIRTSDLQLFYDLDEAFYEEFCEPGLQYSPSSWSGPERTRPSTEGAYWATRTPINLSRTRVRIDRDAPRLGADTSEVLEDMGYGPVPGTG